MNLCDKCFSAIEPQAVFCQECGAPVGDIVEEGSDALVYPELAKANLLRLKGDAAAAEQVCLGILKRFPNNPGAHVLLGDINADFNKPESARQWYEMALELMPDNNSLRQKLERTKPLDITSSDALVVTKGNRAVVAMGAFLTLLVIVAALAFWLGNMRANANKTGLEDIVQPISVNGTAPPRTEASTSEVKEPASEESEDNAPPSTSSQTPQNNMTENERLLFASVVAEAGAIGKQLLHVSMDTQAGVAIATASQSATTVEQQAIEAATIGAAIIKHGGGLTRAKVRIVTSPTGKIAFSGAVTTTSLESSNAQAGTYEWAKATLVDVSPALR